VVKQNSGNKFWNISIIDAFKVIKAEKLDLTNETNPINDHTEYLNTTGDLMTLLLSRDAISNYVS